MIKGVEHIFSELNQLYEKGGSGPGKSTGWLSMDPLLTLREEEWTVVTGIPGHGKSTWVDNIIVNTAKEYGWKWLVFSAENTITRHVAKLESIYIGRRFDAGPNRMTQEDFLYATAFLENHVQFFDTIAGQTSLDYILTAASGCRTNGVLIDPWNELDHTRAEYVSETEYISQCLSRIRRFTQETKSHLIIIAHPTKPSREKNAETGEMSFPIPTLYDIAGSANWRNKCDAGVCVYRPNILDPSEPTQIHVQKVRFIGETGQPGMCRLYFNPENKRFSDPITGPKPFFDVNKYRAEVDRKLSQYEQQIEQLEERLAIQEGH